MLSNSLRFRAVHFAYLFGPPRFVTRDEASAVYSKVCEALRSDDFTLTYGKSEEPVSGQEPRGFSLRLARREGRGELELRVENPSLEVPARLFLGYTWPGSIELAKEGFDLATKAVFEALQGEWTRVVAEVRIRAECAPAARDALGFLTTELFRSSAGWIESLGKPLAFSSVRFEVDAQASSDPLSTPKRDLMIEILRADRSKLYVEFVSQWPQIVLGGADDQIRLRPIDQPPSKYIEEARGYLTRALDAIETNGGQTS